MRTIRWTLLATVCAAMPTWLAAPLSASSPEPPPASATHGHWVQLAGAAGDGSAGDMVAYARIIVAPGFACPSVVSQAAAAKAAPVAMTPRENPYHFPVQVCEARVGFDQALSIQLTDTSLSLPTVRKNPSRVLVMGDSGCKLQKPGSASGCPAGSPAEPFASLAKAAAAGPAPDVILHMGDYNYRGTESKLLFSSAQDGSVTQAANWTYDAGDGMGTGEHCGQAPGQGFFSQSAANANLPDSWQAWNDDFFSAAGPLLASAPWVFARGNHELCSRAGPGWFYFLDPSSNLSATEGGQLSCPVPDPSRDPIDNVVLGQPYAVDLGSLALLVVDSANACDSYSDTPFVAHYTEQMKALGTLAPKSSTAWWMSHRPLWGVTGFDSGESTGCTSENQYGCINQTLQAAVEQGLGGALPSSIDLVLAGHMHRFQSLTFKGTERPPVVVVGTSGVALDASPPVGAFTTTVFGDPTQALATGAVVTTQDGPKPAFGYLEIQLQANGDWQGTLKAPNEGLVLAECGSAQRAKGSVCVLAPGVEAR